MANVDRPNGFTPIRTMSGGPWEATVQSYRVSGSATDIYVGDMVIMQADGTVDAADAAETELLGVMVGRGELAGSDQEGSGPNLSSGSPDLDRTYYDASADGATRVLVAVGPDVLYEAQEDSDGGALALTAIGANVDILATAGSGNAYSLQELDSDSLGTSNGQLRIVDIVRRADNAVGNQARWVVRINENHYTKIAGV